MLHEHGGDAKIKRFEILEAASHCKPPSGGVVDLNATAACPPFLVLSLSLSRSTVQALDNFEYCCRLPASVSRLHYKLMSTPTHPRGQTGRR